MAGHRVDGEHLARLIPAACETLPEPDQARLDQIERLLLARAPSCPQPRAQPVRRRPWWVFGLWIAAAAAGAAVWWGAGVWQGPVSPVITPAVHAAAPPAPSVLHQSHPQNASSAGGSASQAGPERHSSPIIFRK